jgi:hypothetical protein
MLLLLLLPPTIIAGDDDASGAAFAILPSLTTTNPIFDTILSMSIAEIARLNAFSSSLFLKRSFDFTCPFLHFHSSLPRIASSKHLRL